MIAQWWSPTLFEKLLTRILYFGAIQRACDIKLAWWIATSEVAPPTTVVDQKEAEKEPWTKLRILKVGSIIISVLAGIGGIIAAIGYTIYLNADKIPQYVSETVYAGLLLALWTGLCSTALNCIFRKFILVEKYRAGTSNKWAAKCKIEGPTTGLHWSNHRVGLVCGFLGATSLLSAIYLKYDNVMPVAIGLGVLAYVVNSNPPEAKTTMRAALGWTSVPYAIFAILHIKNIISPSESSQKSDSSFTGENLLPSQQMFYLFNAWIHVIIASMPAKFILLNMRYEHSRVSPNAIAHQSKVNSPVIVRSSPILPIHLASLFATAILFAGFDIAGWGGYMPSPFTLTASFMLVAPVSVLTSMIYTLIRGDFMQWWRYTEVWQTDIDWSVTSKIDENGYEAEGLNEKGAIKA